MCDEHKNDAIPLRTTVIKQLQKFLFVSTFYGPVNS